MADLNDLEVYKVRPRNHDFERFVISTSVAQAALDFRNKTGAPADRVERVCHVEDFLCLDRLTKALTADDEEGHADA